MSNDFINRMVAVGELTPDELEKVGERVADFLDELQHDPDTLAEAVEKIAALDMDSVGKFFGRTGEAVGKAMPLTLAAAGSTAAIAGASGLLGEAIRAIRNKIGKDKAFQAMVENAGDRLEGVAPEKAQEAFNTLYRFNPEWARDPAVAAEFIRETSRSEGYPFQLLRTAIDTKSPSDSWIKEYSPFALKSMGGKSEK